MHLGWSFFLLFAGLIGVLALLGTIFWLWMIVDCALNEPPEGNKAMWLVIIVLLSLIGAAIYYFVRRPERMHIVGR
ncbi:MAG TPA: PLD nuclease N-terminal domain-containing protein [Ktedonobacterales bacterium]|nr:PLD nuclease N-terminal domain-containing protein [Ktedonobacterales bacterium]